jgi:YegS/Rv2252/BmrU family lipid kinase
MPADAVVGASGIFVILNPAAGSYSAEVVEMALSHHLDCGSGGCRVHLARDDDDLTSLARSAAEGGCGMVVAAGGDGTVSAVAEGLVGRDVPLAILPLGTANVLARELGIPVGLEAACELLAGPHATTSTDALEVRGRHFYTQIGVGIDALMIRDTKREHKRRFGRLAYIWAALVRLMGFQPRRFTLVIDGWKTRPRASQVVLANCGTLGQPPLRWGLGILPDDGRIDVCILRARNLLDYVGLARDVLLGWHRRNRNVRYYTAERAVSVGADRPLPVQADGEIIGETPIEVRIVPRALRVVVPPPP